MDEKSITIKHNGGLATSIFILQNIFLLMILFYLVYILIVKFVNGEEIKTFFYFFVVLIPFVIVRLLKYLKEIYSLKEYVLTDSKLIIDGIEYDREKIELRYVSTGGRSTLLAAELFIKGKKKAIGLLIISFWAGHVLNVSSDTLKTIFEQRNFDKIQTDEIQSTKKVSIINKEQEEQDIQQVDIAWYLVYNALFIPITLILYLMVKNHN